MGSHAPAPTCDPAVGATRASGSPPMSPVTPWGGCHRGRRRPASAYLTEVVLAAGRSARSSVSIPSRRRPGRPAPRVGGVQRPLPPPTSPQAPRRPSGGPRPGRKPLAPFAMPTRCERAQPIGTPMAGYGFLGAPIGARLGPPHAQHRASRGDAVVVTGRGMGGNLRSLHSQPQTQGMERRPRRWSSRGATRRRRQGRVCGVIAATVRRPCASAGQA